MLGDVIAEDGGSRKMQFSGIAQGCAWATVFFLALVSEAQAGISITPAYLEIQLDQGRPSGTLMVSNLEDTEDRYRINASHFIFSRDGALVQISPDENSLVPWIIFNPKEFSLAPKSKRAIRFVIVPQGKLRPGEYWAAVGLESLRKQTASATDAGGRTMSVSVITKILVPVFGHSGEITYGGDLKDVRLLTGGEVPQLEALVINNGNARLLLTGEFEIIDGTGSIAAHGPLGKAYVLAGMERLFSMPLQLDLAPGSYIIRTTYTSPQLENPIRKQVEIKWMPDISNQVEKPEESQTP